MLARSRTISEAQFGLGAAGARGVDGEVPQDLLAQMLGDMGSAQGAREAFAGEPDVGGGVADPFTFARHHSVDRSADLF